MLSFRFNIDRHCKTIMLEPVIFCPFWIISLTGFHEINILPLTFFGSVLTKLQVLQVFCFFSIYQFFFIFFLYTYYLLRRCKLYIALWWSLFFCSVVRSSLRYKSLTKASIFFSWLMSFLSDTFFLDWPSCIMCSTLGSLIFWCLTKSYS